MKTSMVKQDPHVDAYIAESAAFARPILAHICKTVHAGCPTVEEAIKWGMPFFMHKGVLCQAAALKAPDYFLNALRKNKAAQATFEAFSPSNKREYVEWVIEAKTEETRKRRLETAILWMAEGKIRNWKYSRK